MKTKISILFLLVIFQIQAQNTFKISKPIPLKDWKVYEEKYFKDAYGTATIINYDQNLEIWIKDKPLNDQDNVSWRPPVIPPLSDPQGTFNDKKKPLDVKKPSSIKPKPIDPGCNTCSIFLFDENIDQMYLKEIQLFLENYK
jgi:hypothetical protein